MTPIVVRPAAAEDIEEAAAWYERRRPGLGDEFLTAVDLAIVEIRLNPLLFPILHRNTRRVLLSRFPYALFYMVHAEATGDDTVILVACFHAKRHPRRWKARS